MLGKLDLILLVFLFLELSVFGGNVFWISNIEKY